MHSVFKILNETGCRRYLHKLPLSAKKRPLVPLHPPPLPPKKTLQQASATILGKTQPAIRRVAAGRERLIQLLDYSSAAP